MSKKEKKKKKSLFFPILLILIIIIGMLFFLNFMGFLDFGFGSGFGFGTGQSAQEGDSSSRSVVLEPADNSEDNNEETPEETEPEAVYFDVRVSGSTIIYNDNEVTAEDVISDVQSSTESVIVRITDDDAVQDTMSALLSAFDDASVAYIVE